MREGWKEVRLKDYTLKIGSGVTPRGGASVYIDKGIPLFRSQNIYNGSFSTNGLVFINNKIADKMKNVEVLERDVLINITGDSVARCCYAPKNILPGRVNQHVSIIRTIENKLDSKFLMYYLTSPFMQLTLLGIATGAGATRNALTKSGLEKLKILLPPLPTQRKIASILSAYDDLIENNLKRINLLEEKAQLTYEEWFVRMKFPGHETVKVDEGTGLPEGWEVRALGDVLEISSSKRIFLSDYVSEGIPFYRGKEIILKSKNEALNDRLYISIEKFDEIKLKYEVPKEGDILITAVGTLGYPYLVTKSDGDFYFKDGNLIWLKGNERISSAYLISSFKNEHFQTNLKNIAIGSSQKALTILSLKSIKHLIPDFLIQEKYNSLVVPTFNSIENLQNQNRLLKEARDILLPRLMSGVVDVGTLI